MIPTLGHHHRIDHYYRWCIFPHPGGYRSDGFRLRNHADLDGVRTHILKNCLDLFSYDLRQNILHGQNTQRILGRNRRDDAHAEYSVRRKSLQIGLNSCAAAGIRTGDRQCRFHCSIPLFSFPVP